MRKLNYTLGPVGIILKTEIQSMLKELNEVKALTASKTLEDGINKLLKDNKLSLFTNLSNGPSLYIPTAPINNGDVLPHGSPPVDLPIKLNGNPITTPLSKDRLYLLTPKPKDNPTYLDVSYGSSVTQATLNNNSTISDYLSTTTNTIEYYPTVPTGRVKVDLQSNKTSLSLFLVNDKTNATQWVCFVLFDNGKVSYHGVFIKGNPNLPLHFYVTDTTTSTFEVYSEGKIDNVAIHYDGTKPVLSTSTSVSTNVVPNTLSDYDIQSDAPTPLTVADIGGKIELPNVRLSQTGLIESADPTTHTFNTTQGASTAGYTDSGLQQAYDDSIANNVPARTYRSTSDDDTFESKESTANDSMVTKNQIDSVTATESDYDLSLFGVVGNGTLDTFKEISPTKFERKALDSTSTLKTYFEPKVDTNNQNSLKYNHNQYELIGKVPIKNSTGGYKTALPQVSNQLNLTTDDYKMKYLDGSIIDVPNIEHIIACRITSSFGVFIYNSPSFKGIRIFKPDNTLIKEQTFTGTVSDLKHGSIITVSRIFKSSSSDITNKTETRYYIAINTPDAVYGLFLDVNNTTFTFHGLSTRQPFVGEYITTQYGTSMHTINKHNGTTRYTINYSIPQIGTNIPLEQSCEDMLTDSYTDELSPELSLDNILGVYLQDPTDGTVKIGKFRRQLFYVVTKNMQIIRLTNTAVNVGSVVKPFFVSLGGIGIVKHLDLERSLLHCDEIKQSDRTRNI